jgi:HEAT repeat protein
MSKSDPIEAALHAIAQLRDASPEQAAEELPAYLRNRSNLVAAKAAKLTGELRLGKLAPELLAAFERFMKDPAKLDKRCAAVTEIVSALYEMDHVEPDVYLRGLHHVQMEPSFGQPVDAAAALRGISAQGLLRTRYPYALEEVVSLLADTKSPARLGAVRALATNGGDAGLLLLRLKVLTGEDDPDVLAECFSGLLVAAPERSLEFVARFLDDDEESTVEAAIWALGQSRSPAAFGALKEKWEQPVDRSTRKVLMAAMAASRLPEALDFLYAQIREANTQTASDVIAALGPYARVEAIPSAVRSAVEQRGQHKLIEAFKIEFRIT